METVSKKEEIARQKSNIKKRKTINNTRKSKGEETR